MAHRYLVIDRASKPSLVVLDTDDDDEALSVATKYARSCTDCHVIRYDENDAMPLSVPERPREVNYFSFASHEDAVRAGYAPPTPQLPPSGDGGSPSGDGDK